MFSKGSIASWRRKLPRLLSNLRPNFELIPKNVSVSDQGLNYGFAGFLTATQLRPPAQGLTASATLGSGMNHPSTVRLLDCDLFSPPSSVGKARDHYVRVRGQWQAD